MRICRQCSKETPDEGRFCMSCGADLLRFPPASCRERQGYFLKRFSKALRGSSGREAPGLVCFSTVIRAA